MGQLPTRPSKIYGFRLPSTRVSLHRRGGAFRPGWPPRLRLMTCCTGQGPMPHRGVFPWRMQRAVDGAPAAPYGTVGNG